MKLIDFGLATRCTPDQVLTTKAGTPYYVAPQVLAGKYDGQIADMWSLGVIMYVILCGYPPFYGETDAEILAKVRLGNFSFNARDWKGISENAKNLVRMNLKMNPRDRFTAQQALEHAWFQGMEGLSEAVMDPSVIDRFRHFRTRTKFQKAALQVIATQLGEKDIKVLKDIFIGLDANGNGKVSLEEVKKGMEKAGITDMPHDLADLIDFAGENSTDMLDYTEFLAACLDRKVVLSEDVLWSAFRVFDKDGNGQICPAELKVMLSSGDVEASDECVANIIKDVDKNGDRNVDFAEFVAMMRASETS